MKTDKVHRQNVVWDWWKQGQKSFCQALPALFKVLEVKSHTPCKGSMCQPPSNKLHNGASKHTHTCTHNAITLVWHSLRVIPISNCLSVRRLTEVFQWFMQFNCYWVLCIHDENVSASLYYDCDDQEPDVERENKLSVLTYIAHHRTKVQAMNQLRN